MARRYWNMLRVLGRGFVELLYPSRCAGCGTSGLPESSSCWCSTCFEELEWIRSPLCPHCGRPFPGMEPVPDHLCEDCVRDTYHFDGACSAVFYDEGTAVTRRILQLKFGRQLHWAPPLAELLAITVEQFAWRARIDLLIPVPLHIKRLRERGFNQSALVAKFLGRRLRLPIAYRGLERSRWTKPQTRLARKERLQNVKHAFAVKDNKLIAGKHVLLIDDVFTTGMTLNECSRCLKEAGAARVYAATVARSVPGFHGAVIA